MFLSFNKNARELSGIVFVLFVRFVFEKLSVFNVISMGEFKSMFDRL